MTLFSDSERILMVAPHPDDESLGAGGLLQRAFASGSPVKIIFATNGDNNPWAQRYWERRWSVAAKDQIRWGKRRQEEGLNAIEALGGNADSAVFLNYPDQGITDLFMAADSGLTQRLTEEIRDWEPTLLIIPSAIDSHPDHSSLCVLISIIAHSIGSPQVLEYLIHRPSVAVVRQPIIFQLTQTEIEIKRRAILCHQTQLALGGARFTRFAAPEEIYYPHNALGTLCGDNPYRSVAWRDGILDLRISTFLRDRVGAALLLAFQSGQGGENRWCLPLPAFSETAEILDAASNRPLQEAKILRRPGILQVEIPFPDRPAFQSMFAKLSGCALFFDRSGWFQIAIPRSERSMKEPAKSFADRSR
jgi:LmbE family N-acetylglucosaminyl deacetylase